MSEIIDEDIVSDLYDCDLADEKAELYCPECNRYEIVGDYELGISDAHGIRTDQSCGQCGGTLYIN